jgi:hypothetical protein
MQKSLAPIILTLFATGSAAAETCSRSTLYLGTSYSNALLVNEVKRSAIYTKRIIEADSLLRDLELTSVSNSIQDCSDTSVRKCLEIKLEPGRIVLAFQKGKEGHTFVAGRTNFVLKQVEANLGVGLGDVYWIEYRGLEDPRTGGLFSYSTKMGVLSISIRDPHQENFPGPSLMLVQGQGLLAEQPCH